MSGSKEIPELTIEDIDLNETDWIDRWLTEYFARKVLRRKHPWALYLIQVLWAYDKSGLARMIAIDRIRRLRTPLELPMPKKLDETIQSTFQSYSSQYPNFARREAPVEDDLFYSVGGKGSGRWAVHRDRARAWVKRRGLSEL